MASQALRGRMATLASVRRMLSPSAQQQVTQHQQPQAAADGVLDVGVGEGGGRPEGLDEGGHQEKQDRPADQLYRLAGRQAKCLATGQAPGGQQGPAELEAGGSGQGDGGQLERAMAR